MSDKRGGLEIIDVTDTANPVEIGLTSHIGESHTVNIDPKRPHIAYAVTSDSVSVDADGKRAQRDQRLRPRRLRGRRHVVVHGLPGGHVDPAEARRVPAPGLPLPLPERSTMAMGHTNKGSIYGCHELEVYPNDRLTCGSGGALSSST